MKFLRLRIVVVFGSDPRPSNTKLANGFTVMRLAIPLTSTGKIDKKVIRAQLEADDYKLPDLR